MKLLKTESYLDMSRYAAKMIAAQVILKPNAVLGLATGSTPIGTYAQLVEWYKKGDIDFSQAQTVNLDEYCKVDSKHEQSYRHFMNKHLFSQININPGNTRVPDGMASDLQAECQKYDALIDSVGGIELQLLGIGHNGHIGFNEPAESFTASTHIVDLKQSTIDANARFFASAGEVPRQALTIGMKSIMGARKILLIVSGKDKQQILNTALHGPVVPQVPASILQLHPDVTVVTCE